MAQPTASAEPNGIPSPAPETADAAVTASNPDVSQVVVPTKRKREDDVDANSPDHDESKMETDATPQPKDSPTLIRNVVDVLTKYDTVPSLLQRPLPDSQSDDEPDAKRQRSDTASPSTPPCIAQKAEQDQYPLLGDLAIDIDSVVQEQLKDLQSAARMDGSRPNKKTQDAIEATNRFREKALEILRREMVYPRTAFDPMQRMSYDTAAASAHKGSTILTVFGKTPQGRPLFSSLPKSVTHPDEKLGDLKHPSEFILPSIIKTTRLVPTRQLDRSRTLGEVFGPTRPLPPLQPPKQPKPQTKGNVLGFRQPQLVETSSYRSPSYFSQKLSVGYYIDYSNTAASSLTRTEPQQSPSASEREVAEMEGLFRGAFSSFAPCKNDAGAVVPVSLASRVHWYKAGQRDFSRMIEEVGEEAEGGDGRTESEKAAAPPESMEVDEDIIEDVIKNWDPALVDPALNNVMGKPQKSHEEKEVDELLDEVSDMIATLASHQRIRHLTLPSSQNRYSGDPANSDMLTNSTGASPSEDEEAAYEALKAQLALIVKTLPPYAVAKLDGDQLNDLLVSTKLEVRTEQSKGLLEDDSAATQARARQQQQAPVTMAAAARPASHRLSGAPTYGAQFAPTNQYGTPTRPPMPQQPPFYRQGLQTIQQPHARPGAPHAIAPQPYRQQINQAHRPANGYANHYVPQLAKTQTPYGHHGSPQYAAPQRPPQFHNTYGGTNAPQQHNSPAPRYQPGYGQPYPPQPGTPTPANYGGYANGTANLQPRSMSPQVRAAGQYSPSPPLPQQAHPVAHAQHQPQPHPHHQRQYAPPHHNMPGTPVHRQQYATNGGHQTPSGNHTQGPTGYMTPSSDQNQHQQRLMEQARARAAAQQNSVTFGDKLSQGGQVAGMTGTYDASQFAAAQRARMVGGAGPKSQSPVNAGGLAHPGVNGTPAMQQQQQQQQQAPQQQVPQTPVSGAHEQNQQQQQQPTQMPQPPAAQVQPLQQCLQR